MTTNTGLFNWNALASNTLGIAALALLAVYWLGWKLPVITSDRAAMFALAALGLAMCTFSMGRTTVGLGWLHPISIVGIVLGVLAGLLVLASALGWRLPLLASDRAVLIAMTGIVLTKWALGLAVRMFLIA